MSLPSAISTASSAGAPALAQHVDTCRQRRHRRWAQQQHLGAERRAEAELARRPLEFGDKETRHRSAMQPAEPAAGLGMRMPDLAVVGEQRLGRERHAIHLSIPP
jgi:hypothetical protein